VFGATTGRATVLVSASPQRVYGLVSDITRMGEWSPECRGGRWLDGATGPAVGALFEGDNQLGPRRWSTTSKVVAADPGREFAFTVIVRGREATRWRYRFEPKGSATVVTESFDYVWAPWYFATGNVVIRRGWQLRRAMQTTLARLKALAEATPD
jgi:hypothetical protein